MIRFIVGSALWTAVVGGLTLAAICAGDVLAARMFGVAALVLVGAAATVALRGRARRRAFAAGFALAAGLYLLFALATPRAARWENPLAVPRLALGLFVQLQRTREPELECILMTLDVAAALALGWLGGSVALLVAGGRRPANSPAVPPRPDAERPQ